MPCLPKQARQKLSSELTKDRVYQGMSWPVALCCVSPKSALRYKGYFGPWIFRPKSTRTLFLDISCPISGHFGSALVFFNQFLGNFYPVCGCLNINIETIINWIGAQNPTKSVDLDVDQILHPCSLIRVFLFTGASLGFMDTKWALSEGTDHSVWVRLRDQSGWYFSLLTEERYALRYNGTPMEILLLSAWLRMLIWEFAGGMLFYRIYWTSTQFIKMIYGFYDNIINITL